MTRARALAGSPHVHAAAAYVVYGLVYLAGALAGLSPERRVPLHGVPWWAFYVAGAALVVVLPLLIAKGRAWLAGVLAVLVACKAVVLCLRLGLELRGASGRPAFHAAFAVVAAVTALLLLRSSVAAFRGRRGNTIN